MTNKIEFYKYLISSAKIVEIILRKTNCMKEKDITGWSWPLVNGNKKKKKNEKITNERHLQAILHIIKYPNIPKILPNYILRY